MSDPTTEHQDAAAQQPGRHDTFAPGVLNANWFGLFNAMSWGISLGAPAVLYAKSLGASATVLGVMTSLTPLLTTLQLAATHLLPKYGYRRFVLMGWGSRTVVIFLLAGVPLLTATPAAARLWLTLGLLFVFNVVRGLAAGAWWPWISEIVPERLRGRFLSRDQVFAQVGAMSAALCAAVILSGASPRPWQFAVVFLISALAQTASLVFLNRMPEVTSPEKVKQSGHRVPWAHMLRWPPFLRMTAFNLIYLAMSGGLAVFTVSFLKARAGYSESLIMYLTTGSVVGALATVTWVGRLVDREGSLPVIRGCLAAFALILVAWALVAGGVLRHESVAVVACLQLLQGVAVANFTVANSRLTMGTIPLMGRNHFFALFSVITNLGLGVTPIAWGALIDSIGDFDRTALGIAWNRYTIYFAAAAGLAVAALAYTSWLREGESQNRPPASQ